MQYDFSIVLLFFFFFYRFVLVPSVAGAIVSDTFTRYLTSCKNETVTVHDVVKSSLCSSTRTRRRLHPRWTRWGRGNKWMEKYVDGICLNCRMAAILRATCNYDSLFRDNLIRNIFFFFSFILFLRCKCARYIIRVS